MDFRKLVLVSLVCVAAFLAGSRDAHAQFKEEAFSQNYENEDEGADRDTSSVFSLKSYVRGLRHKQELKTGTLAIGSSVFVGGWQIYNRDYWKLPIIYGGLAGSIGAGLAFRNSGNTTASSLCFVGAAALYWGTTIDGVINYPSEQKPHPGKSTLYSLLCPGLGQVYNGEAWKVPFYWGCILGAAHFYDLNKMNYKRFRNIYIKATDTETTYDGPVSAETALYYRDIYRRYRDYSLAAMIAFYLLQAIDANVFAYMQDFKVSDDLSMSVEPTLIGSDMQYAAAPQAPGVGLSIGLRF